MRLSFPNLLCLILGWGLFGCSLQKDIDLNLPNLESDLVVECYLEPGQPYRLTVFQSTGFFDRPEPILAPNVIVTISHKNRVDTLAFRPFFSSFSNKLYTHSSTTLTSGAPGDVYTLTVRDIRGRVVTGTTTLLAPVPMDTIEWTFNDREEAFLIARFKDKADTKNFYRFMVHQDSLTARPTSSYLTSDQFSNGELTTLGTPPRFKPDEKVFVTLYHVEEAYYNFLNSTNDAQNANGNPFGQPAAIRSTLTGGIGVFTNLSYDRREIVIVK